MTIKGIDISVVQGNVDFHWLKAQGIEFVIVRCGVGNDGADQLYAHNIASAKAAGLRVMAYHFVYPLPSDPSHPGRDAVSQARAHFKAANGEIAAVDVEWPDYTNWTKWGCSASQINKWTLDYLNEYERLSGRKMVVYTYPSFAKVVNFSPEIASRPLWIASYTQSPSIPGPWQDWAMWQTEGGKLMTLPSGVPVDTNVCKDWSLWKPTEIPLPEVVPAAPSPPIVMPPPAPPPTETVPNSIFGAIIPFVRQLFKF